MASVPETNDIEAVVGTNWVQIAKLDTYQERTLGAEAWVKCVRQILNRPDMSADSAAERLHNWLPALYHFSQARIYDHGFVVDVIGQLEKDADILANCIKKKTYRDEDSGLVNACALYEASIHLSKLRTSKNWRHEASVSICEYFRKHQKKDGTIDGDVQQTLRVIETVMPPLAVAYMASDKPDKEVSRHIEPLMEFLMYYLDMYGCVPFVPETEYIASNKREWLFWAAKAFGRKDFAWVAYDGLDMLNTRPPSEISKAFSDAGIYVMRNNWEIRRLSRRSPLSWMQSEDRQEWVNSQFHYMSHTMSFDAKRGLIDVFAFALPQVLIELPVKDISVSAWRTQKDGVICEGNSGQRRIRIVQLTGFDAWVVRIDNIGTGESVHVSPRLTRIAKTKDNLGLVTTSKYQSDTWDIIQGLRFKPHGAVCLRTDGTLKEGEGGSFDLAPRSSNSCLTVVMMASAWEWSSNDIGKCVPPDERAQSRKVVFLDTGCEFANVEYEAARTQDLPKGMLLKFSDKDIVLAVVKLLPIGVGDLDSIEEERHK